MTIRISYINGSYSIKTPYSSTFVNELKATVPAQARKWSATDKIWIVSVQHGEAIKEIILKAFGKSVDLPEIENSQSGHRQQFEMRYLGAIKDRDDFSRSAYGFADNDWKLVFPEAVLKLHFKNDPAKKSNHQSLYEILTIDSEATANDIRIAYRRLAKLTHPDVNKEPDAVERFRQVQNAYELLSDATKRARYDAGLALMQTTNGQFGLTHAPRISYREFQSPIRCGQLDVTGEWKIGRLVVETIHTWSDIIDLRGFVLVTSWRRGDDHFTEYWVDPRYA